MAHAILSVPRPATLFAMLLSSTACVVAQHAQPKPAQPGLTAAQVFELQSIRGAAVGADADGRFAMFTRSVPRPIADGPGGARTQLLAFPDLDAAIAGDVEPVSLHGEDESVRTPRIRPGTRDVSFLWKNPDQDGTRLWTMPISGGKRGAITDEFLPSEIQTYRWRPDGQAFAFTALADESPMRAASREAGFNVIVKDEDFRHVELWIYELDADNSGAGKLRQLTKDCTVFDFRWSPNGTHLVLGIAPRNVVDDSYMETKLFTCEAATGELTPLANNPGKLGDATWSPDSKSVVWIGAEDRRDPHAGMLFFSKAGDAANSRPLTPGLEGSVDHVVWVGGEMTASNRTLLLCAVSRGVRSELALVDPTTGEFNASLLRDRVAVSAMIPFGTDEVLLVASTPDHPAELWHGATTIAEGGGKFLFLKRLTNSNPWLKDVGIAKQEVVRFDARDGLSIEGLYIHPLQRSETPAPMVPAPLVIVAHGGPEAHFDDGWLTSYSQWGQVLAAKGYGVWFPNYRSSTGYGVEFVKKDHGDPMGREFEDHLDAIAHFNKLGWIDPARVGIGGGSYGGYTAAWAATKHTEAFAAAVSFVPFVDMRTKWLTSDISQEFFAVHYEEKWWWEQADLLNDRSPLTWARDCRTPMLLLGGTSDPRVHPSQPHMLWRAVKQATTTPCRYVQYPGEGHGNRRNVSRVDYLLRTIRWFDHYLAPGENARSRALPPVDLDVTGVR